MAVEFKLPDLGEGVKKADVVKVLVKVGDAVAVDQNVLEVETDKAGLDVPSTVAGTVTEVRVQEGDSVPIGAVVLVVEEGAAAGVAAAPAGPHPPAPSPGDAGEGESTVAPPGPAPSAGEAGEGAAAFVTPAAAAPSVRRFAREIGVDIHQVVGTGPGGRVTDDDVKLFARLRPTPAAGPAAPVVELPDFTRWGPVTRERLSNVRRATAAHMALCWSTIPHVTVFDKADITELEDLRQRMQPKAKAVGAKLTVTAMMVKLVASALKVHPNLNASLDTAHNEVVRKGFYHIGVAADTPRGLVVPVIRDADQKNMIQIAGEIGELAASARAGKIAPDAMSGGTFTVTNLGGLGIGHFTPIVNHPEVGILGLGRAVTEPVWIEGAWQPRLLLPLSLSFDHRLVDGADGARFLRWIVEAIAEPLLLVLEG